MFYEAIKKNVEVNQDLSAMKINEFLAIIKIYRFEQQLYRFIISIKFNANLLPNRKIGFGWLYVELPGKQHITGFFRQVNAIVYEIF